MKGSLRAIFFTPLLFLSVCAAAQKVTVSGYVTDKTSGETLISAEVICGNEGTVANNEGRYSLTLAKGPVTLSYYYTGYKSASVTLNLQRDTTINMRLEQSESLAESRVSAVSETGIRATQMGVMQLPVTVLQRAPVILGEQDVLKTVQLLPGIQQGMDGFSNFFVRGGAADENMFLLDGVPLYNVSHMLGLFSAFTPESVKSTTIYKGAFPARYGGRVSGVVDIRTNEGDQYKLHGTVGAGLLSSKLHLEGPIVKGKTTFSLSGRLMHTILLTPVLKWTKAGVNYGFYDVTAKVTHRFSDRDKLSVSAFVGQDDFGYDKKGEKQSMNWGNIMAALKWHHVFDGKWSLSTMASYNSFGSTAKYGTSNEQALYNSSYASLIQDGALSTEVDGHLSPRQHLRAGVSGIYHHFAPSTRFVTTTNDKEGKVLADLESAPLYNGWEFALFAEDEITLLPGWTVLPGLRYVLMTSSGSTYHSLQPRLSMRYGLPFGLAFKAGYARMGQYVHQLSASSIALPSDIWVPVTSQIKPVVSDIASLGIYYDGLEGWQFSVEAYAKLSQNVIDYRDGASMYSSTEGWESLVEMGLSRSMGLEFYMERTSGPVTGWISYTLSKTDRRFPSGYINSGNWFPYKYDRRHIFHIYLDWAISQNLDISATWSIMSGAWLTLPERTVAYLNAAERELDDVVGRDLAYVAYYYPARNNYHLPPSHTLNVSVNYRKKVRHGVNHWAFSVYNLYDAMNPNMVFMHQDHYGINDMRPIVVKKVTYLPILPSVSYTFKF